MAKYSNVVEYNVVTNVDTSGIVKLQNELTKLKQSLKFDKSGFSQLGFDDAKIEKSIQKVNQLQTAITAAFNPKIGTIDLSKLNASLQKEHTSLQMIVKDWEQMGTRGTMAISNLSNALLSMNKGALNVNTTLSKIANTFGNTVRWGITASIFQEMMSSVQGAVSYMKDLDESLTQIQMVTNSSKEDMRELAQYANNAAQALGSTTVDYTNAVKVFVQEGFSEKESKQYANLSTKLANVSEQNTATTSDQITAYRNAFQLDYQQTVEAMDKVANVANNTASNVNELMTASQRAASVAQAVGSSQDSFLAAIATIESVTRQSAEEIGNGLKTIYQRFADIKVSGSTEDGVDYGQYANALKSVGVDVLDVAGQFKGMDQILSELQDVWSELDDTMKIAVGEKVAGKFQYNRFAALMNNPEYYQKALGATQNASGMMDQMNEYYMEGIEGRLKSLQAAGEQVISTLFDQDNIEPVIEQVTELVNGLNSLVDAAGGLTGVVQVLGAVMLRAFSTQIAGTVSNMATAMNTVAANSRNANQLQTSVELVGLNNYGQTQEQNSVAGKLVAGVADKYDQLSVQTQEKLRDLSQQIVELEQQKTNVLKEQTKFFDEINTRAKEEGILVEENARIRKIEIEESIALIFEEVEETKVLTDEHKEVLKSLNDEKRALDGNVQAYVKISAECNAYIEQLSRGEQLTTDQVNRVREWRQEADHLGINVELLTQLVEQLGIAESNLNMGEKMTEDIGKVVDLEARINSVVKTISSITSIAFGFSMISDTIKTLTDDSATLEDKLDAVLMNGAMGVTMLLPGLSSLAKTLKTLRNAWIEENIAKLASMKTDSTLIMNLRATVAALWEKVKALGRATVELIKNAAAQFMALPLPAKIAIGVAALTVAIVAATDAYIKNYGEVAQATKEYEKQNEILTETKRNYQDVTEKVETLNSSLDKISDMRSSLDDMKEGTDEWKEAVRKLNSEILTLIQTYPEIAKFVNNENGVLSLDSEKSVDGETLNDFYNKQIAEANHLNDINSIQQITTLDAKNNQLIAEYAQKNNVSSENVKNALDNNKVEIAGREDLTSSFTELAATIQSNNATIETLTGTIGTLNTNYENLAGNAEIDTTKALQELQQRWGNMVYDEYGNELGYKTDLSALNNNSDLLKEISAAIGKDISSGIDTSIFDDTLKVITKDGEEIEHSTEVWMQILANSEEATRAANELFETNKYIYETLGAKWDDETQSFTGEINEDTKTALNAYNNDESFRTALSEIAPEIKSVKEFAAAIKAGAVDVEGLSEAVKKLTPNVEDLTTNINGNTFTNRIDKSSDEDAMKDLLSDSGMSEGAFNRMSRNSYEEAGGYYQKEKERLEDLIAAKREDGEVTEEEAEEISKMNLEIEDLDDAAKDTTAAILRMSNGVVKLRSKIEDISEILTNDALEGTTEWYQALDDLDKGLSEVLNIDAGTLSDSFIESGDALAYAQRMAEGDMSAIDDLRRAAAQDIIQNLTIQTKPGEDVEAIRSQLMTELNQLQADIDAGAITINTDLDTHPFTNKLDEMLAEGQISAEQASQILSSIGMDAKIEHAEGDGTVQAIEYSPTLTMDATTVDMGPLGSFQMPGVKMVPNLVDIPTKIDIPYLVGTHYTGSGVQTANTAARNPSYTGGYSKNPTPKSSGSSPKSSSSKPKNNRPKDNAKNEWDYLTDITNDLDRQATIVEKLSKLEDKLYGKSRVSNLRQLQKEHKKNVDLLKQELELAKAHAKTLRSRDRDENGNLTINGYAKIAGFDKINFDSKGNLENGKAIEAALTQRLNNAIADYNAHRNDEDTSYYEETVRIMQEDHDGFMKALDQYQGTLDTIDKVNLSIQDEMEEIQKEADKIIDGIQEGVEDVVKAIDNQRNFNKAYREWMEGGSSYSHFSSNRQYYSEGLAELLSPTIGKQSVLDVQLKNLKNRTKDAADVYDIDINTGKKKKDKKGTYEEKLTQKDAQENLQKATEDVLKTLSDVVDYYDSLLKNVSEASAKMDELIDDRLKAYDDIEDYLDTRLDQIQLLFGDNYGAQVELYNRKIDVNMGKMAAISAALKAKQITVEKFEAFEAENKKLSEEERKELQDARNEVTKLQQEQLNTETKLLQDISSKLKSQVSGEMKKAVNNMFGGNDVEWIAQQWEVATRNSEQYLDDYNRAFELQKLQLKYQDMLSDAQETNIKVQQRISSQMEQQLEYLRNKTNLSEYDVQYAEKQLEILQKQIALEEARDNKSQMRLQRNAAGNYDFVYGADEEAVNQATQALLNAQQEAYNLSKQIYLETYNSAVQAALQTKDMVIQIATDASIGLDEKTERIKYIIDSLNDYMQNSSIELGEISINLYNDFIEADTLIADENLGKLQEIYGQIRDLSANTTAAMKSDLADYRDSEDGVNASWESIKDTMATSLSEMENSSDASWSTMKEKIGEHLSNIGTSTSALFTGEDEKSLPSLFKTMTDLSNTAWGDMAEYIVSDANGLPKIKQGAIDVFDKEKEDGIPKLISAALTSIDERFVTTKDNSIGEINKIDTAAKEAKNKITTEYLPEFQSTIETTLDAAGDNYDTFISDSLEPAKQAIDDLNESTTTFKDDLNLLNDEISTGITEMNNWKTKIDAAYTATNNLIPKATNLAGWIAADSVTASEAADNFDSLESAADGVGSAISTLGDNARDAYWAVQSAAEAAAEAYRDLAGAAQGAEQAAYAATNAINSIPQPPPNVSIDTVSGAAPNIGAEAERINNAVKDIWNTLSRKQLGILNRSNAALALDTGGYTGTWTDAGIDDKNGKLAILHQKELVLNESDTKNMLSVVEVVRDIMANINKLPSLGNGMSSNTSNSNVEQRVEISASFPGVTTALEIERALTELADNAYQYANKYKY